MFKLGNSFINLEKIVSIEKNLLDEEDEKIIKILKDGQGELTPAQMSRKEFSLNRLHLIEKYPYVVWFSQSHALLITQEEFEALINEI